ncbi:MAG: MBL fold metallo-hydrolase [Lachnospiraceae bacterium]|nr:MBL fold metallo-hydrolase [Lachnospiraceae bacterium]
MKRPLLLASLFLVIIAALRFGAGGAAAVPPGAVSTARLETAQELCIAGQVYQKDEKSIYLKSVIILKSDALGHDAADSGQGIPCTENIICELTEQADFPLGRTVALEGVFYPYSQATNPGEFDSAVYYRTLGIGGKLRKAQVLYRGEDSWPVRNCLYELKCHWKERLYRIFPEKEAAVMSALLLGDKSELDSELKDLYKRNGILHILSISSLHITIIGMSVYRLLRKVGLPVCPAAVGGSVLLLLYGGVTGFSVSACRAIGMYLIRMAGEMTGRTYDMLTALGVMGAGMVAVNPWYLQSSGFLLSFSSVLGIGVVSPVLAPQLPEGAAKPKKGGGKHAAGQPFSLGGAAGDVRAWLAAQGAEAGRSLLGSAVASLSITLTTLPIQLWFYYEIPIYSVFLNLFVLPLMKPMMITGLLAMLTPGLGILGTVDLFILKSYEALCAGFDGLPFHTWNPGCPKIWQIVVYYLLLGGVVLARAYRKDRAQDGRDTGPAGDAYPGKCMGQASGRGPWGKRIGAAGGGFFGPVAEICTLAAAVLLFAVRPPRENSVTFLDVGQGDCILVRTASGENYLFDCGSSSRSSVGRYVLLPYLKYHGIRNIDAVFLSHPDTDHVNGAVELLETGGDNRITVGRLLLPAIRREDRQEKLGELEAAAKAASQESAVSVGYLKAGDEWECGSARFVCVHPQEGFDAEDINACSLCFYVVFAERPQAVTGQCWTMLLTGDVQNEGEAALREELQERDIGDITLLKAAHHGSKNSTPRELLQRLSPRLTVISSGRNNRYGHPHGELLERLEESGTVIVQTAAFGAITVTYSGGEIRVTGFCF